MNSGQIWGLNFESRHEKKNSLNQYRMRPQKPYRRTVRRLINPLKQRDGKVDRNTQTSLHLLLSKSSMVDTAPRDGASPARRPLHPSMRREPPARGLLRRLTRLSLSYGGRLAIVSPQIAATTLRLRELRAWSPRSGEAPLSWADVQPSHFLFLFKE